MLLIMHACPLLPFICMQSDTTTVDVQPTRSIHYTSLDDQSKWKFYTANFVAQAFAVSSRSLNGPFNHAWQDLVHRKNK